jgi:hypothetical protein
MKTPIQMICGLALAILLASSALAVPLGTGFTYQGQLVQSGTPVNGTATLRFSLWDAAGSGSPPAGGTQIGASQILANVPVANGMFTVQLNGGGEFGASAFKGDARWLQIEVCTSPSCTAQTALAPRQPITATPYASYAAGPWRTSGANVFVPSGNVGIGTATPQGPLDVASGTASFVRVDGVNGDLHFNGGSDGLFSLYNDSPLSTASTGFIGQGAVRLLVANTGNVGIGTIAPTQKLDVRGEITMGASGQYFASGGQEDIWMVRGAIDSFGSSTAGCCYSVTHSGTGVYDIVFTGVPLGPLVTTVTPGAFRFGASTVTISGGVRILVWRQDTGNFADCSFSFITMGQR